MVTAVVLGATGFVGSRLTRWLQQRGIALIAHDSRSLDLLASDGAARLAADMDEHTVLFAPTRARGADALEACEREVAMATTIARALALSPASSVVFFSTLSVYSDLETNLRITEETLLAPTSYYGTGKLAAECIVRQAAASAGVRWVVLRPCKIYGPGDTAHTYGPVRFIEGLLYSGVVELFGDGSEERDFVFVDDVVRAAGELALIEQVGTFNVATGISHSFVQIVDLLRRIKGDAFVLKQLGRHRPRIDQHVDPQRLLEALPGFAFTALEDGLRATYEHYCASPAQKSVC